ncbi:MAG: cell wall metabolism sensor histidine kinase WalK [Oscillospiraceae bacterium]|nr:cell wall metabolism sensor histidine kinase WalK [Oscillospiraceae bacterium]
MTRSIYTKLVAIILVLIVALMTVVGAFLMQGVRNFYVESFYTQMQEIFARTDIATDLRAAADSADAAELMAEILRANMGRLGIDSDSRNYYILDGKTGAYLTGSDAEAGPKLAVTRNILTALSGSEGYEAGSSDSYMDVALPVSGESGSYIIYIIDSKSTMTSLNAELFGIILNAIGIGLAISIILSLLLAKTMVTPIQELTQAAKKVAAGDFSEKVENPAQDEIGVLTRTFNDMAGQLERNIEDLKSSEQVRREFVANVSHELRTPVTSIRSYAETLADAGGSLDAETERHFLEVIVGESDRMAKIVQDLLLLSRFDAGQTAFSYEEFSFEKSIRDVYEAQMLEAKKHHHSFQLEFRCALPAVWGDRARIEQVLINMVSNAIKYTRDGGRIRMTAGCKDDTVWCSIRDNGIGIPKADVDRVFERFYRVDKARSRESGGTGLGLSIAYEIVQRHNGTLTLKSQQGKGTTITMTLPVGGPQDA